MEAFQTESPAPTAIGNRADVKPSLGFNRPEIRGVSFASQPSFSGRESDGNYRSVVAVLNDRWRVIVCRDHIQWILQFGKSNGHGTAWRGRSYCRTREALIRVCAEYASEIRPSALSILETMPERI